MIIATKSPHEREEAETERLVRPLPKLKPPRHDRRRERVEVDEDPDLETKDKDKSLNYKDVGGSMVARLLARFARETPKPPKKVKVRLKDTGHVTEISEETLRESPSKYEKYEEEEGGPKEPSGGGSVHDLAKGDAKLETSFKELTNPKSDLGGLAEGNPNLPAAAIFKTVKFPPEIKTLGDLVKALRSAPKAKPGKPAPKTPAPEAPTSKAPASEGPTPKDPKAETSAPDSPQEESESPEPSKPRKAPKEPKKPTPKDKETAAKVRDQWLAKGRQNQEAFQEYARNLPTTEEKDGQTVFFDPKTKKRVPFESLSPEAQTKLISDFSAKSKQKSQDAQLEALDPKVQDTLAALADSRSPVSIKLQEYKAEGHKLDEISVEKLLPELKGVKLPAHLGSLAALVKAAPRLVQLKKKRQEAEAPPKRREPTKAEKTAAMDRLLDALPPNVAGRFFNLHPDDVEDLVSSYEKFSKVAPKDLETTLEAAKGFTLNPQKVQGEPKYGFSPIVKDDGKPQLDFNGNPEFEKKDFKDLSSEEKAIAKQRHRMEVVAASMVTRERMSKGLEKAGVPSHIAPKMADVTLTASSSPPRERERKMKEAARTLFTQAASGYLGASYEPDERFGSAPIRQAPKRLTDSERTKLLKASERLGPEGQMAAVAHLQGEDYYQVHQKYLSSGSEDRISERDTPEQIAKKLKDASSELEKAAKAYPKGVTGALDDPGMVFRTRARQMLSQLDPDKSAAVGKLLSANPQKMTRKDREEAREWLKDVRSSDQHATAYSSYGGANWQMATHDQLRHAVRTALYHGVKPYPKGPEGFTRYPRWQQAHQRDLAASDFEVVLASAAEWLKSPILTKSVEGMVPDARYRAALDLAISHAADGKYNRAFSPPLYDLLLASLANQ